MHINAQIICNDIDGIETLLARHVEAIPPHDVRSIRLLLGNIRHHAGLLDKAIGEHAIAEAKQCLGS